MSEVRRCAVLGSPVAHSLSPVLHRAAYAELGLDWVYEACEVSEPGLAAFLDGLDGSWRGLSLTMPLKRAVVPLLDSLSLRAEQALAANTVVLTDDGRREGHNTDVPGAAAALRERYDGPVTAATVLGGGATASSTLLALADLGCRTATLLVRDEGRAADTLAAVARHPDPPRVEVRRIGSPAPAADVLVSTVPAGAQTPELLDGLLGGPGGGAHVGSHGGGPAPVVFDVVYDPWPTPLAARARATGRVLVSGLDLLVHQAALQVELMTGCAPAPLAAMRAAGERALEARGG